MYEIKSRQTSVASPSPFCDSSCKFIDRPYKCLVYRCVPSTSMSRQFVSTLSIILQLIQALPFWIGDNPSRDLKLCRAAPLFCLPTRSISQRIFEHVLPCRGTTRHPGYLSVAPAEICDSNIFVYSSMIISFGLHSRWVHPMWSISSTCPAILMSSTDTEKNNPAFDEQPDIPNLVYIFPSKFQ